MRSTPRVLSFIRIFTLLTLSVAGAGCGYGQVAETDSAGGVVHRIEVGAMPAAILHTNQFLEGKNVESRTMNHANAVTLKYALMAPSRSLQAATYKGAYQGIGVALHDFNPQLGNPVSAFIYQGATIVTMAPRLALNYEWNLGLAMGWRPYDAVDNPDNHVIGSRVTANITAELYLTYRLNRWLDVNAGVSFTHFSNGNTKIPNAGLNTIGAKLALACYVNREATGRGPACTSATRLPDEQRRWQTDVLLYGAWKCKGVTIDDGGSFAIPGKYLVAGASISPLRRMNPWLRLGAAADLVYDHSANIELSERVLNYSYWNGTDEDITQPAWYRQIALGVSARVEFTMPYFSINIGAGHHLLNAKGDFEGFYEMLALKVALGSKAFLNIGYSLYDYRYPNNLMLGLGYRF